MQQMAMDFFVSADQGLSRHQRQRPAGDAAPLATLAFAAAVAAGLALLADRAGAPAQLVLALAPLAGLAVLAFTGLSLRTMQVSRFFAGGRALPSAFGGLAGGGMLLAAWLLLVPGIASSPQPAELAAAMGAGQLAGALVIAPLLRKSGAFSLAGFLAFRFPGRLFRFVIVCVCSAIAALAGLAGAQAGLHALTVATGWPTLASALVFAAAMAAITLPGGLGGAAWSAAAAAACLAGAMVIALALQVMQETLPALADAPAIAEAVLGRLGEASVWPRALTALAMPAPWMLAGGTAMLGGVAGCFAAAIGPGGAVRAAVIGLGWWAAMALLALACMAAALSAADRGFAGRSAADLPQITYLASGRGEILLCGKAAATPAEAVKSCAGRKTPELQAADVKLSPLAFFTGFGAARNPPAAAAGLLLGGYILVHLAFAALAVQALATTLAHEGLHHLGDSRALTSRRLALARLTLLLAIAGGVAGSRMLLAEPHQLLALALCLCSAVLAPLMALALWPLATGRDALLGLAGAGAAALFLSPEIFGPSPAGAGDSLQKIAAACVAAGLTGSLFHRRRDRPRMFFSSLWRSNGDLMARDRAA